MDKFYREIEEILNEIYFTITNENCILNVVELKKIFKLEFDINDIKYQ